MVFLKEDTLEVKELEMLLFLSMELLLSLLSSSALLLLVLRLFESNLEGVFT